MIFYYGFLEQQDELLLIKINIKLFAFFELELIKGWHLKKRLQNLYKPHFLLS